MDCVDLDASVFVHLSFGIQRCIGRGSRGWGHSGTSRALSPRGQAGDELHVQVEEHRYA